MDLARTLNVKIVIETLQKKIVKLKRINEEQAKMITMQRKKFFKIEKVLRR